MGRMRQTLMVLDLPRPSLAAALARALVSADPVMVTPTIAPAAIVAMPRPPIMLYEAQQQTAANVMHRWREPISMGPRSGPMKPKAKAYKGSKAAKKASRARR